MSTPDPTTPDHDLPPDARLRLRTLVEHAAAGTIGDDELHAGLADVAAHARSGGVAPERCLIALRQAWAALPPPRVVHDFARRETLQWRLVSQLIRAYYYDGDGDGKGKGDGTGA